MVRDQKETRIGGEGTGMKILYVRDENAVTSIMTEESEKHCSVGMDYGTGRQETSRKLLAVDM